MAERSEPIVGGRDFIGPSPLDRYYATSDDGWLRIQVSRDSLDPLVEVDLLRRATTARSRGSSTIRLVG